MNFNQKILLNTILMNDRAIHNDEDNGKLLPFVPYWWILIELDAIRKTSSSPNQERSVLKLGPE